VLIGLMLITCHSNYSSCISDKRCFLYC